MNIYTLLAQTPAATTAVDNFDTLAYILRALHILAAVLLAGGIAYQRLVLLPSLQAQGTDPAEFLAQTRSAWSRWVGICALVIIASGLVNFFSIRNNFDLVRPYYQMFFGIKFLLALVIIFIASVLSGRRSLADKFRAKASFWLSLNLTLIVVLILLASAMRIMPKQPKVAEPAEATASDTDAE